ncbi:hypothetical protein CAAN3_23S01156 [[Candida] anglica]
MSFQPEKPPTSYSVLVARVQAKRLRYINKIAVLVALVLATLLSMFVPQHHVEPEAPVTPQKSSVWWTLACVLVYRAPFIWIALIVVRLARDSAKATTAYSASSRSLAGQWIASTLSSSQWVKTSLFYVGSSFLIYLVSYIQSPIRWSIVAKEYRHRDKVNEDFIFYIFSGAYVAFIYALHQVVWQYQRLSLIKIGVAKLNPQQYLFKNKNQLWLPVASVVKSLVVSISSVLVYYFLAGYGARSLIYKAMWPLLVISKLETASSASHPWISFNILSHTAITSFVCVLGWDLLNHFYTVYACIGCLDGDKPLSSYSSDPINTLLSGLRGVEGGLPRVLAFQELAYLATTSEDIGKKLRLNIYNAKNGSSFWSSIVEECSLVIREGTSRVNFREYSSFAPPTSVSSQLVHQQQQETPESSSTREDDIFGNSIVSSATASPSPPLRRYVDSTTTSKPTSGRGTGTDSVSPLSSITTKLTPYIQKYLPTTFWARFNQCISRTKSLATLRIELIKLYSTYHQEFLSTVVGAPFRITPERDAEVRIRDPVTFGNAVIALANLLQHAAQDDRRGTVSSTHIAEVLTVLERPIRAFHNYSETLPSNVYLSVTQRARPELVSQHVVALLHDLCVKEFFDVCIKYNSKLNDLVLSSRVFKLAKRVIDTAIAQQQRELKRRTY